MTIKLSDFILENSISDSCIDDIIMARLFAEMDVRIALLEADIKQHRMQTYMEAGMVANLPPEKPTTSIVQNVEAGQDPGSREEDLSRFGVQPATNTTSHTSSTGNINDPSMEQQQTSTPYIGSTKSIGNPYYSYYEQKAKRTDYQKEQDAKDMRKIFVNLSMLCAIASKIASTLIELIFGVLDAISSKIKSPNTNHADDSDDTELQLHLEKEKVLEEYKIFDLFTIAVEPILQENQIDLKALGQRLKKANDEATTRIKQHVTSSYNDFVKSTRIRGKKPTKIDVSYYQTELDVDINKNRLQLWNHFVDRFKTAVSNAKELPTNEIIMITREIKRSTALMEQLYGNIKQQQRQINRNTAGIKKQNNQVKQGE